MRTSLFIFGLSLSKYFGAELLVCDSLFWGRVLIGFLLVMCFSQDVKELGGK